MPGVIGGAEGSEVPPTDQLKKLTNGKRAVSEFRQSAASSIQAY